MYLVILMIISLTHSSPLVKSASPWCSYHLTKRSSLQSSKWKKFLDSGMFNPTRDIKVIRDDTGHHIKRLRHKLSELVAIINFHKDRYVEDLFSESYDKIDKELEDLHFLDLIPSRLKLLDNSANDRLNESSFLEAYSIFQHLAISIEIVTSDQKYHHHSTNKMWRLITHTVNIILRNIYTELVIKGVSIPIPLTRNIIPDTLRCIPISVYRNTRDFIVLRDLLLAGQIYTKVLGDH